MFFLALPAENLADLSSVSLKSLRKLHKCRKKKRRIYKTILKKWLASNPKQEEKVEICHTTQELDWKSETTGVMEWWMQMWNCTEEIRREIQPSVQHGGVSVIVWFWCFNIHSLSWLQLSVLSDQCDLGVRFLDLRIARKPAGSSKLFFAHGIYTLITVKVSKLHQNGIDTQSES